MPALEQLERGEPYKSTQVSSMCFSGPRPAPSSIHAQVCTRLVMTQMPVCCSGPWPAPAPAPAPAPFRMQRRSACVQVRVCALGRGVSSWLPQAADVSRDSLDRLLLTRPECSLTFAKKIITTVVFRLLGGMHRMFWKAFKEKPEPRTVSEF